MAVKRIITMPDETTYTAVLGHWLPKLLRTDDVVFGHVAYFRLKFKEDGTLISPSPGHLGHAGIHVQQFRKRFKNDNIFTRVAWAFIWIWHLIRPGNQLEDEADVYAEANKYHPKLVEQFQKLRERIRGPIKIGEVS